MKIQLHVWVYLYNFRHTKYVMIYFSSLFRPELPCDTLPNMNTLSEKVSFRKTLYRGNNIPRHINFQKRMPRAQYWKTSP